VFQLSWMCAQVYGCVLVLAATGLYNIHQFGSNIPEALRSQMAAGNEGSETLHSNTIRGRISDFIFGDAESKPPEMKAPKVSKEQEMESYWSFVPGFFTKEEVLGSKRDKVETKQKNGVDAIDWSWSWTALEKFGWKRNVKVEEFDSENEQTEATQDDYVAVICANADALTSGLYANLCGNLLFILERVEKHCLFYFLMSIVTPVLAAIITFHETKKRKKENTKRDAFRLNMTDGLFYEYFQDEKRRKMSDRFEGISSLEEQEGGEAKEAREEVEEEEKEEEEEATKALKLKPRSSSAAILASVIGRLRLSRNKKPEGPEVLSKSESDIKESEPVMRMSKEILDREDDSVDGLVVEAEEKQEEEDEEDEVVAITVIEDGTIKEVGIESKEEDEEFAEEESEGKEEEEEEVLGVREREAVEEGRNLETSLATKWKKVVKELAEREPEMNEHGAHIGPMGDALEACFPPEIINLAVITSANCWKGGVETLV